MPEFEFSEKDQNLVDVLMERFDRTEHGILVEGTVRSVQFRTDLTRQYGGQYTADKMGNSVVVETNIPCDAFVNVHDQEAVDTKSSIPVAVAYMKVLNRELLKQGYEAIVHHGEEVIARKKELTAKPKEETF